MSAGSAALHRLASHAELLHVCGDSTFVRYDLPVDLEGAAYAVGRAVAVPRRTHTRRLGLLVMGPVDDVAELVAALVQRRLLDPDLRAVTVERPALAAVERLLPLGEGNDWEWLLATAPPAPAEAEARLVLLSERDRADIDTLLALANPGTDARPFAHPGQHWVGVRDDDGTLVACGVRELNLAGWPVLSGITVHPRQRGRGLAVAVTARLTREAVQERGVCTLGLYSHNDVARRLYVGLGYQDPHLWSSRRLA